MRRKKGTIGLLLGNLKLRGSRTLENVCAAVRKNSVISSVLGKREREINY
jgi:hypothetical protein